MLFVRQDGDLSEVAACSDYLFKDYLEINCCTQEDACWYKATVGRLFPSTRSSHAFFLSGLMFPNSSSQRDLDSALKATSDV